MNISIDELQHEYNEMLQRARPHPGTYRFDTSRTDVGSPHVEIVDGHYDVVTTERGLELERKSFLTKDDLLYDLIALVTFWDGVEFEFRNRIANKDCRRIIFAKQLELLGLIDPDWAVRRAREIEETLRENPYDDSLFS